MLIQVIIEYFYSVVLLLTVYLVSHVDCVCIVSRNVRQTFYFQSDGLYIYLPPVTLCNEHSVLQSSYVQHK